MGRRRPALFGALAAVVLLVGYVAADAADVVPGPLTTAPLPAPPEPFPTAPGAVAATGSPPVLPGVGTDAPQPDPVALAAVLAPLVTAEPMGPSVSVSVVDALTGSPLYTHHGDVALEPASVVKVLTGAAALHRFTPDTTIRTRVVQGLSADEIVLVGGGDVLLADGAGDPAAVAGRAGMGDLAAATATALAAQGRTTVAVRLDDSLFQGPAMGPGWLTSDIDHGFAAPVSPVAVNAGRTGPDRLAPRHHDPALAAAGLFAAHLAAHGVQVVGEVARVVAPPDARTLASVESAPLVELVEYMLQVSENNVAESLARLVARDVGRPASFADAAATVLDEVALLGPDTTGARIVDGSGLGDGSVLPATLVADLLSVAAAPDRPRLRPLLTGLPVAGLNGTLGQRFGEQDAALGLVRAKTGSLTGVTSLAGTVVDQEGRLLAFAVIADQVPATGTSRQAVDAVAAALAACGCR